MRAGARKMGTGEVIENKGMNKMHILYGKSDRLDSNK